jgi:hypothetical protein
VLEDERPRLLAMAGGALFVQARHPQSAGRLEDLTAVGIVAVDAVHLALDHRVVLGQAERICTRDGTINRPGVLARIEDQLGAIAGRRDMLAAGSMAISQLVPPGCFSTSR